MCVRIILVMAVILSALLTTGCNGSLETDEISYVILIGLDKAEEEGKVKVTYQIAIPRALGGESGAKGGSESSVTLTVTAANLAEARNMLNSITARAPNLSHNKAFIIGEEMARQGIGDLLSPVMRFREFRGTIYIIVAYDTTAQKFIENLKPKIELLPSKYIETTLTTQSKSGYYLKTTLHDFYNRFKSGSAAPYAVLAGINPMTGQGRAADKMTPGLKAEEYLAGSLPYSGQGDSTELVGTAIFKSDKMVGVLTSQETRMLSILSGESTRGFLVVTDPEVPKKAVNVNFRLGRRPQIDVSFKDGRPIIRVDVLLEGEITAIPSGINYEAADKRKELERHISQIVRQEMMNMLEKTRRCGSDAVGFGYYAQRRFSTWREWQDVKWEELYPQAEFDVKVATRLRRTGLLWRTVQAGGNGAQETKQEGR